METAALAQACKTYRAPFPCIRAMSESAHHFAGMSFAGFLVGGTTA